MPFLFLDTKRMKKAIKLIKLIVANENTSHLLLHHLIVLTDDHDC